MKKILPLIGLIFGVMTFAFVLRASPSSPGYTTDIKPIMQSNCSACHDWNVAYTRLVGPVSQYSPTIGLKIVYPSKPDSSVLVWRLEGKLPSGGSIDRMPKFGSKLPDADILTIRTWIQQGAPENAALPLEPPSNVQVSDVPDDQGYFLHVTWTISPSDTNGAVSLYRIFHSRSSVLTDPLPMSQFTSREDMIAADAHSTILVDSVAAGVSEYIDFVPVKGEPYTVWLQAVGSGGASKLAASGAPTSVEKTPLAFLLKSPFPNPFNPSTTIEYVLPHDGRVLLKVYTVTGQQAAVLSDRMEKAGRHAAVWNAAGMPSGVYIYTLSYGGTTHAGKMALMK